MKHGLIVLAGSRSKREARVAGPEAAVETQGAEHAKAQNLIGSGSTWATLTLAGLAMGAAHEVVAQALQGVDGAGRAGGVPCSANRSRPASTTTNSTASNAAKSAGRGIWSTL